MTMITVWRHYLRPEPQRQFMIRLYQEQHVRYVTTTYHAPAYDFFSGNALILQHAKWLLH